MGTNTCSVRDSTEYGSCGLRLILSFRWPSVPLLGDSHQSLVSTAEACRAIGLGWIGLAAGYWLLAAGSGWKDKTDKTCQESILGQSDWVVVDLGDGRIILEDAYSAFV